MKDMNGHRLAQERSLALHLAVADLLAEGGTVLERARTRVHKWLETGEVATYWAREWDRVLSKPLAEIQAFLVERSEHATAMRQITANRVLHEPVHRALFHLRYSLEPLAYRRRV